LSLLKQQASHARFTLSPFGIRACLHDTYQIMPSKVQPSPEPFAPSSAHIALAIALIRAKPAGTSARGERPFLTRDLLANHVDYVLQLRDQVRPGSPETNHPSEEHYLDLVAYWKNQCERLQEENDQLRNENTRLERSNHSLTSRTSCTPDFAPGNAMNTSKRKARTASPTRNPKRMKGDQSVDRSVEETQEEIDEDMDFLDSLGQGELNGSSLRHRY
jgi:hypothetical protein